MKTTYWFIENVKKLMTDLNISQTKLAERAGLSQGGLSDLLQNNGRSPSLEVCEKISEALGYPLAALLVRDFEYPVVRLPMAEKEEWLCGVIINRMPTWNFGFNVSDDPRNKTITKSKKLFKQEFEEMQRNYVKDLRRYS